MRYVKVSTPRLKVSIKKMEEEGRDFRYTWRNASADKKDIFQLLDKT